MTITIPFPPATGNMMWRHSGRKHYLTEKAKRYYFEVAHHVRAQGARFQLIGSLEVSVDVYPPDRRKRDLDNIWKVVGDALTRAGVWEDDSMVHDLRLRKMPVDPNPRVVIRILSVAKTG